jgi:hypothetical protein
LEDMWVNSGKSTRDQPFTQRWSATLDFYTLYYKPDLILQQGIRVETAIFSSLYSLQTMDKPPQMMIAQGETSQRRLRVQLTQQPEKGAFVEHREPMNPIKPMNPMNPMNPIKHMKEQPMKEPIREPNKDIIAVPHPEYPDTYDIWIKGVKKGYAAVQDIDLSRRLKKASSESSESHKGLCVNVEWNEEFSSYEIVGF